jgi:hypothetical protein
MRFFFGSRAPKNGTPIAMQKSVQNGHLLKREIISAAMID